MSLRTHLLLPAFGLALLSHAQQPDMKALDAYIADAVVNSTSPAFRWGS
ncbi:MAG: hypothetical protein IPO05_19310 [Flavobacteriales bacterium]|nr:hypothetical protein [Flavobacteriales bacterium]